MVLLGGRMKLLKGEKNNKKEKEGEGKTNAHLNWDSNTWRAAILWEVLKNGRRKLSEMTLNGIGRSTRSCCCLLRSRGLRGKCRCFVVLLIFWFWLFVVRGGRRVRVVLL
jgi:hypothetical protein